MSDSSNDAGFLEEVTGLTLDQVQEACDAAFGNATALLEEADLLRGAERCARAYFLAHIACEELGKLPILAVTGVSVWMGTDVDWKKVDRSLRSHDSKIRQVLFEDSLHGSKSFREQEEEYEEDVKRLRVYTDMKNASLYSFYFGGRFLPPGQAISCEFFDGFRELAESRLRAFEGAYMKPVREAGGLQAFLAPQRLARVNDMLEGLTGSEGHAAFEEYRRTGDEAAIRALFDRLLVSTQDDESLSHDSMAWTDERLAEERQRARELLSRQPPPLDEQKE